ncbi:MAG TPA: GNAT family N-acetyltransferase [Vicinamibacteria bacterium]
MTRTYLERTEAPAGPAPAPPAGYRLERASGCPASFYRYLYAEVGRAHHWTDRLAWSDEQISAHLACPGVSLHVLGAQGVPAGYFELVRHDDGSVEIAYFGLLPGFLGRGLGRYLLEAAVARAFGEGTARVWLHTCTLDHPAALGNYLARGFRAFRQETYLLGA